MYRNIAERLVDGYSFDWEGNLRMRETCVCSVEIVCSTLVNSIIVAMLACLVSKESTFLIFFLVNGTVRLFSGGMHARSYRSCSVTYCTVLLVSVYMACYLESIKYIMYILCVVVPVISISINFKYGGMQEHLEEMERKKYRKVCKCLVLLYSAILIGICAMEIISGKDMGIEVRNGLYVQCFAMLTQSVLLFLGRKACVNYRNRRW